MSYFLKSSLLANFDVQHGFGTRLGGVSLPPFDSFNLSAKHGDDPARVKLNQKLLAQRFGIDLEQLFSVQQVSADQLYELKKNDRVEHVQQVVADAIVAKVPKQDPSWTSPYLSIRTADCLPILLVSPKLRWIGVVHVGWQGALQRLLAKTLHYLHQQGAPLDQLYMGLGPAIGPCCLKLRGLVAQQFIDKFPKCSAIQQHNKTPTIALNLWEHSRDLAIKSGVPKKNIDILDSCTVCDSTRFFSYRRQGVQSGRQVSLIGFRD